MSFADRWTFFLEKKFLFSLALHLLHGFIFEKSKLYYPYTFNRNILLFKTDLFKFYISSCFIFLGMPYVWSKFSPKRYYSAYISIENRYRNRTTMDFQVGSYFLGLAMIFIGFCPSYLPIYLAISPILFLYSIAASYTMLIFFHVFGRLFSSRGRMGPVTQGLNNSGTGEFCSLDRCNVVVFLIRSFDCSR